MILICRINEVSEDDLKKLYLLSDDDRKLKADRIKNRRKKALSLAAGLLSRLLREKYGFKYTSISHSGDFAACMGENRPCGMDIEKIRKVKDSLIDRVCTEEEKELVNTSENKDETFIRLWTEKEAFFKAGVGESLFSQFRYSSKTEEEKAAFEKETFPFEGYIITACVKKLNQ